MRKPNVKGSRIVKGKTFEIEFNTALDFILFKLSVLIQQLNAKPEGDPLRVKNIDYVKEMQSFLNTRIISLKIFPSPESDFPFKYSIDYSLLDGDTKEEIENKLKEYLRSDIFNLILSKVSPEILAKFRERDGEVKDQPQKMGKFKRSGHLTDQILKYSYPRDKQPSLFDNLNEATKKKILQIEPERSTIVEGIKLSPPETKVIDCLCKLLHNSSQTSDAKKEDYYSGNKGYTVTEYGGIGDKSLAPTLGFTLYELTKEYKGGEQIGGKDVENVRQILTELDSKRFLLSYVETSKKKDGGRIERKIEDFAKLIHIVKLSETEYNKENIEQSRAEEIVIILNPIFSRQIDSKFILYPNDINRRTQIAYGSHNLSEIALKMRDYLIRELSNKRYNPEVTLDRLYYILAEKWMRESRKPKVKQYTEKALEMVKALGLLISYEIKPSSTGEPKIVFTLNKKWE
jgi:hypothetical protein